MAGFAARPQRIPAAANESPQPGGALSLLLPRHSLFRQRQAFQPASFISICELAPRPKQRNALTAKISGKKPLIYLNLAIFQANLRPDSASPPDLRRKMAQTKAFRMTEIQARQQENGKDACKEAEEQLDGAAPRAETTRIGADGETRTPKPKHWLLRPACLPIPPHPHLYYLQQITRLSPLILTTRERSGYRGLIEQALGKAKAAFYWISQRNAAFFMPAP